MCLLHIKSKLFCEKIEDPSYASIYIDRLTVYRRVFQALKQQGCSEVAITINRAPEKVQAHAI